MKKIFIPVLALMTLAGCVKDEGCNGSNPLPGNVEVKLQSPQVVASKAPVESAYVNLPAYVIAKTAAASTYTTLYASSTLTFASPSPVVAQSFDTPMYYPKDGTGINLFGMSPQGWSAGDGVKTDVSGQVITASRYITPQIDGKTDIMSTLATVATSASDAPSNFKSLTFEHLLTLVRFKVVAAAPSTVGTITSIAFTAGWEGNTSAKVGPKGLANNLVIDPVSFNRTFVTNAANPVIPVYKLSESSNVFTYTDTVIDATNFYTPTAAATYMGYSIVSPLRVGWGETTNYAIDITAGGVTKTNQMITIDTSTLANGLAVGASSAGYILDVTLTFSATEIEASATVSPWKAGGTGGITL